MFKAWWEIFKALRTPFTLPLDTDYNRIPLHSLSLLRSTFPFNYVRNYFDCDDFAWVFKGAASVNQFNCVGLVIGWWHGLHCWNVALTDQGVYQIEPQTGEIFTWKKGYVPLFVIL